MSVALALISGAILGFIVGLLTRLTLTLPDPRPKLSMQWKWREGVSCVRCGAMHVRDSGRCDMCGTQQ